MWTSTAMRTPWPICQKCSDIPTDVFCPQSADAPGAIHPLWPAFSALVESAARGCHTCTLFFEAVREPFKSQDAVPVYLESLAAGDGGRRSVYITLDLSLVTATGRPHDVQPKVVEWTAALTRFTPVADVRYLLDADQIPKNAKFFQSKYP